MSTYGAIYYYYLLCKWKDDNNREYTCRSDFFYNNPIKLMEDLEIKIYIHPKYHFIYYVDCNELLQKDRKKAKNKVRFTKRKKIKKKR